MNLSMNSLTLNTVNNATATVALNGAPAQDGAAIAGDPLLAGALPATPIPTVPFQQWIGLDPALADSETEASAETPAAAPDEAQSQDAAPADQAADVLLAAMSAPLLPASMPSALPAMMMAMPGAKSEPRAPANDANARTAVTPPADAATALSALSALSAPARAPVEAIAPAPASPAPVATAATVRADVAAAVQAPASAAKATTLSADAAGADGAVADSVSNAGTFGVLAATQPASTRAADSVTLAGPPAAWRQTLHEALGERLQLQAGRGVEQATIRLEPPMLGRIDIAIRHSAGSLEVHIAASNGEVLRQLNTVSDALRSDLAGRQFSSVSVSVSETPRAQATAQAGNQPGQQNQPGADGQGRGRQPGQEQRGPGLALNDAGDAGSLFSMNGRD
jgi:flagellar hook-length control protein FliK